MFDEPDASAALPLESLYLHLVRAGFPISARDYGDALRALRAGHGIGGRQALHRLCRALWARGDEELVRMDAVFRRFRPPTVEEVQRLTDAGAADPGPSDAGPLAGLASSLPNAEPEPNPATSALEPGFEFGAASEAGHELPAAGAAPLPLRPFVFEPRLPLSERSLVIAWRRLRRVRREGPPVELDIDATIARQCAEGWMLEPVRLPARRNLARLLVLLDVSPSMRPWRRLHEPLVESLRQGRLADATLLYFDNDPLDGVHESPALHGAREPASVQRALGEHMVLVVGDAGAARGLSDRARLAGLRRCAQQLRAPAQALAWLNPLPATRWGAAAAALRPAAAMFEAGDEGLVRAVDHLRGQRSAL